MRKLYERLILPFVESHAPIHQISWGAAIGMFVGLTPTMGVQMYIVAALWAIVRFLFRFNFNLPIAVALVWITNPVTVVPLYYLFLVTGNLCLGMGMGVLDALGYEAFKEVFSAAEGAAGGSWLEDLLQGVVSLFWTFGWPMIVGGLVWATPMALLTYPVTSIALLRYRRLMAAREGLSYEEWKRLRVRPD